MSSEPDAARPTRTSGDRPSLAEALDLSAHPEGGWYAETWRSAESFHPPGYVGPRSAASLIYFVLYPGEESAWHVVASDEVWLWHRGGPLTLLLGGSAAGGPSDTPERITVGPAVELGQRPQAVVPAGTWQAAAPVGDQPALVSCLVVPGFDFADFRML